MPRQVKGYAASTAILIGSLIALVVLRSWVLIRSYADFDADQAIFGIMAKDLLAGRGFPLFMYGQRYLLSISSWLCAPLFYLFGATITTLKLPMFLMNIAVAILMWLGLRREPRVGPIGAFFAVLPFAIPSVLLSSRLVSHHGGNIEPMLFIVLAYFLRRRPIALGFLLGVSYLNREFSLLALIALVLMDAAQKQLRNTYRQRLVTVTIIALVSLSFRFIARWSNSYFGSHAGPGRPTIENIPGFFLQQIPSLIGGAPRALRDYNIASRLTIGNVGVSIVFAAWLVLVLVVFLRTRPTRDDWGGFPIYLILIGAGQSASYLLLSSSGRDPFLLRYVLLVILGVCGLVALAWQRPALRGVTAGVVLAICGSNLLGNVRLLWEYHSNPPQRDENLLASYLVEHNVRFVRADYWLTYAIDWVTNERVIATPAPGYQERISRFRMIVDSHPDEVYTLVSKAHDGCQPVYGWLLCPPGTIADSQSQAPTAKSSL